MNIAQKKKILQRIVSAEHDLEQLREVRQKLATAEFASATMSSGGGSRSYTRSDLSKVSATIAELALELKNLRSLLSAHSPASPNQIYTVYR